MQENKINKSNIITILIFWIVVMLLCRFYTKKYNQRIEDKQTIIVVDTTYNTVTLDSIEYNIIYRDSVVYKLKQKMQYEKDKVLDMSDNDAVKLFYELVSE